MSLFNPEYMFTCTKCHNVWYMTKKEIKEAKKATGSIAELNRKRMYTVRSKSRQAIATNISLLQASAAADRKCPCCGSHSYTKEKVK